MITYVYWFLLGALSIGVFMGLGVRFGTWKGGMVAGLLIFAVGAAGYYAYFEQIFVKRYGGTMTIGQDAGRLHIGMTWKDDNLWVETWDPQSNECHFSEYARSGLLEGSVVIKDCNPLPARVALPTITPAQAPSP